jgi:hypothetical protein
LELLIWFLYIGKRGDEMVVIEAPYKVTQYKPITTLANWVQGIFIISGILAAISLFSGYLQSQLLNQAANGEFISLAEAQANDNREAMIGFIQTVFIIICIIIFLMWVYRANKNLHSFERPVLKFTPGWVVGWFFIPFASLVQPYKAVAEISRASDPSIDPSLNNVEGLPTAPIVGWWWTFFLISNFLSNIVSKIMLGSDTAGELLTATHAYMISDVIDIIGIVITILMVRQISTSQELRYNRPSTLVLEEA